ncbi:MAG: aminoacyl-tRNA hydrolase, partial [Actinomycetota bacterium]|nr:aminoacyl-tRNA hydrolase [Actinomycetota bacterium]
MVVIGLGNPGAEFDGTRHNVGADVVDLLAARAGGRLRAERGLHARAATVQLAGSRVLLAVPTTFMNESGAAAAPLVRRGGGAPLVVVHDELDLPAGRLKVKVGGGNAGHHGLRLID